MTENADPKQGKQKVTAKDILAAAENSVDKARREAVQSRVKAKVEKRMEHERAIAQIDEEIQRELDAFEAGQ